MRRVVISGIGAVTPLACNFPFSWDSAKRGLSGISGITRFDGTGLPWKTAGELKSFDAGDYVVRKDVFRLDPFIHYALAASAMALGDAGLISPDSFLKNTAGVIIGSSRGGITTIERSLQKVFTSGRVSPYVMPSTTISMAASSVALKFGITGNCLGISNACASGANALGEAYRLIRHGYADLLLAGGSEAPLCRLCVDGYGTSGALSKITDSSASRPFDASRSGFVIAEGAAVVILEEYESALRRNAKIYGEIIGYGNTTDAFHMTKPDSRGEVQAIRSALADAGISPEDVDYINAHGTSTAYGDRAEAEAIKTAFGDRAAGIPVSALKSMTGHMLAASGAFEAACTAMSLHEGVIPPTINLREKDPGCDINVITEKKDAALEIAISNSFGFGGVNAVLVLRKL